MEHLDTPRGLKGPQLGLLRPSEPAVDDRSMYASGATGSKTKAFLPTKHASSPKASSLFSLVKNALAELHWYGIFSAN